jgi:Na+-transporting NADH:ubiquinone oxidoreductase subunit NqrC
MKITIKHTIIFMMIIVMICGYRISTPLLTIEPKQKKIVLEDENIVKRIDENV